MEEQLSQITHYLDKSVGALKSLNIESIKNLSNALDNIRVNDGQVFIIGNGGSASTASHFATDLGVGSLRRKNAIRALSLCDNSAAISATANDINYDDIFEQQIRLLARPGDALIAISASGNSKNLLKAVDAASEMGITVFSLTGFDGGKLKEMTPTANIHVKTEIGDYGIVEDLHLAICHMITECIRSGING